MEQLRRSKRLKERTEDKNLSDDSTLTFNTNNQHPLLNGLILENVFGYLKGQKNGTALANYRPVCKLWDQEIVKFLRMDTQINLTKLLAPYPFGMGWTTPPENSQELFLYKTPYPEVRQFENIIVTANSCENFKNDQWIKWFELMGSQVKCLKFSSPFTCFCQNVFLERILKQWCPNLECLELHGVKCSDSLLLMSSFTQKDTNLLCKNLKELKIIFDAADEPLSLCPAKNSTYSNVLVLDVNIRKLCLRFSVWKLVNFMYEYSMNSYSAPVFPEIVNTSGRKVRLQIPLERGQILPDLSTYFAPNLRPTDGGIIGEIMKEIQVEKFVVEGLNEITRGHDLVTFFHIRPNLWRGTLQHLELNEYVCKMHKELQAIAQVKFPLKTLKLGGMHYAQDNDAMTKFLEYFSTTLEHLEISGPVVRRDIRDTPSKLWLPALPKLKTFIHENLQVGQLVAENIWTKAPNLETCLLDGRKSDIWPFERFFVTRSGIRCSALTNLQLGAAISGMQAEQILGWFPNLLKMEMCLRFAGACSYGFFEKLERSKVEDLNMTFLDYRTSWGKTLDQCKSKTAVLWKTGNIKKLKSLELNNMYNISCHLSPKLFKGKFESKLTSLTLKNFGMENGEKEKLLKDLSHVPSVVIIERV